MITCPSVSKTSIRGHYDLTTPFYRLLWGPHIHHGLWDADEAPRTAQLRLTETLADRAAIRDSGEILDIGCGMGGSAIHLARTRNCRVTGVTLSPVQRWWAAWSARFQGVRRRTRFCCADAETMEFSAAAADVVWSIECTEHLFDKPRFFRRASDWLKPGGRVAICAWLAADDAQREDLRRQVVGVCEGFFCPSLGTAADYLAWMASAGLSPRVCEDWTPRVIRTWEICRDRVRRTGVRRLAQWIDRDTVLFLDRFETILQAYETGAMKYGCLVAVKPARDGSLQQEE